MMKSLNYGEGGSQPDQEKYFFREQPLGAVHILPYHRGRGKPKYNTYTPHRDKEIRGGGVEPIN